MSRASRFFLWVIVLGLAFIAGLRFYRAYERRAAQEGFPPPSIASFGQAPIQIRPEPASSPVYRTWSGPGKEMYLEDIPLSMPQQKEQARQTIASILRDYGEHPKIQAFYADIRKATGREDLNLAILSEEGLPELLQQYPQLQQVIAVYAKDPEFAKLIQEIFSNPQFAHSVTVLQGESGQKG